MSGEADRSDYDRLRDFWRGRWGGEGFEDRWRKTLVDGVVEGSRPQAVPRPAAKLPDWTPPARQEGYAIVYRPDPSVFDGRFANNAWLQECPQPFSKAVWGNAIEMSPEDAAHAKIAEGDEAAIVADGRVVYGPVRLSNGLAPGVLRLSLGYGRKRAGAIGDGVGFNASVLRNSASPRITRGATLRRGGRDGRLRLPPPACLRSPGRRKSSRRFSGRERLSGAPAAAELQHAAAPARRRPLCMGDGDRYGRLHRLQRLRRRVPVGKQRPPDRAR